MHHSESQPYIKKQEKSIILSIVSIPIFFDTCHHTAHNISHHTHTICKRAELMSKTHKNDLLKINPYKSPKIRIFEKIRTCTDRSVQMGTLLDGSQNMPLGENLPPKKCQISGMTLNEISTTVAQNFLKILFTIFSTFKIKFRYLESNEIFMFVRIRSKVSSSSGYKFKNLL